MYVVMDVRHFCYGRTRLIVMDVHLLLTVISSDLDLLSQGHVDFYLSEHHFFQNKITLSIFS